MIQHEKHLFRFVSLFKSADVDKDGIINEEQFRFLIKEMNVIPQSIAESDEKLDEEIERLLMIIDPHKSQQITFSEMVTFLTLTEFNQDNQNKDLEEVENGENYDLHKSIKSIEQNSRSNNVSSSLLDKMNEGME